MILGRNNPWPKPNVVAGAGLVNAHGGSQFQPMLQLLEGYLDKKDVADEARYDKVREGAIVFLGTLARHLDPSDAKVWEDSVQLNCAHQ